MCSGVHVVSGIINSGLVECQVGTLTPSTTISLATMVGFIFQFIIIVVV